MWRKIPIITICLMGFVIAFAFGVNLLETMNNDEKSKTLEELIMRSALHCYSLEGAYPEELNYLEDNYHLVIDRERYIVHYENFADNIAPDITVIVR